MPDETVVTANGNIYYGGTGDITVDGSIHAIATSGGVGDITTNDTVAEVNPVPSANLGGLVTDGSAGVITINGNVKHCLVVGDAVLTSLGTDGVIDPDLPLLVTNVVGINGTPTFGGDITVTGNLGTWAEWVPPQTTFYAANTATEVSDGEVASYSYVVGQNVQAPSYEYAATYLDTGETAYNLAGVLFNLNNAYGHEQVSAPDGIGVNITVGGSIETAIISGKRILVDQAESQSNDSITGNIIAGQTATTTTPGNNAIGGGLFALLGGTTTATGGNINGDIWSGDMIGAPAGGTVIEAFSQDLNGAYVQGGDIAGIYGWDSADHVGGHNDSVLIYASGGSAGNITSNILADADISGHPRGRRLRQRRLAPGEHHRRLGPALRIQGLRVSAAAALSRARTTSSMPTTTSAPRARRSATSSPLPAACTGTASRPASRTTGSPTAGTSTATSSPACRSATLCRSAPTSTTRTCPSCRTRTTASIFTTSRPMCTVPMRP